MKAEVPKPLLIVIGIVVIAGIAFGIWSINQGEAEFAKPETGKVIPKYVWDGAAPDQQSQWRAQGYVPEGENGAKIEMPTQPGLGQPSGN